MLSVDESNAHRRDAEDAEEAQSMSVPPAVAGGFSGVAITRPLPQAVLTSVRLCASLCGEINIE